VAPILSVSDHDRIQLNVNNSSRGMLPRSQTGPMRSYALARLRSSTLFAAEPRKQCVLDSHTSCR